jgi:Tfp pilus assembly protein PilW
VRVAGRTRHRARRGTTIVEFAVATFILALILSAIGLVSRSGTKSFRKSAFDAALENRARIALATLAEELEKAGSTTLVGLPAAPLWTDAFSFDEVQAVSSADGSVTWSPSRLQFEYEPGETNNGADDNGNGLVDEGRIVLVRYRGQAGEMHVVLARWVSEYLQGETGNGADDNGNGLVDEHGVCFSRSGSTIGIRLALQRRDADRRVVTRTFTTAVKLRN